MAPNQVQRTPEVTKPKAPSRVISTFPQGGAVAKSIANEESSFSAFKFFPKLPLELRLLIWKLSLSEGRVIEFSTIEISPDIPDPYDIFPYSELIVDQSPPTSLLHVNRESRSEALQRYELLAGGWRGQPIYVNYERDTLSFATVDDLNDLCDSKSDISESMKREFNADGVLVRQKIHHVQFRESDFLEYGDLKDMALLESITVESYPKSNKIMWIDEYGDYQYERWSKEKEEIMKAQLVESWTGLKKGLWTGSKDRLPSVTCHWKQ